MGTLLLKLHGDVRHPKRLIITEADYDGFLTNYPLIATYLSNLLITKTAVFVGYSLDDPDFRQIWHVVASRLGKSRRMAYAIMVGAKPGDIARFERRGVKVINLPGTRERYGAVLAEAFSELREYRREHAGPTLKATEEKPLEQFLLPRDAMTRLCLFATPLDVLPFCREHVFPIAEAAGFVPVTAADIINLGESISAKIDTLIDRAAVMVVDASSQSTQFELALAKSRSQDFNGRKNRRPLELVPVFIDIYQIPSNISEFKFILRPPSLTSDSQFINDIALILNRLADEMGIAQRHEPKRLYEVKEYRAAVISAMTLLETVLQKNLSKSSKDSYGRPITMRQLLELSLRNENMNEFYERALEWSKLRNEVVHSGRIVTRNEAKIVIDGVENILAELFF